MCMAYDAEPATVHRSQLRSAAKVHRCSECRRDIAKGETYEYVTMLFDGRWSQYRTCAHCLAARRWLSVECNGWIYGFVIEDLIEHWMENDLCRSLAFGRICVLAHRRWKGGVTPEQIASLVDEAIAALADRHRAYLNLMGERDGWEVASGPNPWVMTHPEWGEAKFWDYTAVRGVLYQVKRHAAMAGSAS